MSYKILVLKRAFDEIDKAFEYYNDISPKIAKKFNTDLQNSWTILQKNPIFQIRYKDYRAIPFQKFPFIIVYTINEDNKTISVYALFHTAQSPDKLP